LLLRGLPGGRWGRISIIKYFLSDSFDPPLKFAVRFKLIPDLVMTSRDSSRDKKHPEILFLTAAPFEIPFLFPEAFSFVFPTLS
jgi:hypothetical protein